MTIQEIKPKVFISYSWKSPEHQELIRSWADRLLADGIDVVIDIYDLNEGDDLYAFMERTVTDKSITHVLVFCENNYANKANERKAGVGTEAQIISKEVYDKVTNSKFIPIICEFDVNGKPFVPTYFNTRFFIDFSSDAKVNENWEQLIRRIYGKPQHTKPRLGNIPLYITTDETIPTSHIGAKFNTFKQALLDGKKSASIYRAEFMDSCIDYADQMRIREDPKVENWGERVLEDARKLTVIRNHIVDWVLLESRITDEEIFSEILIEFLERLRELKSRPVELTTWPENWFEAESVFVYETFLYIIATLIKNKKFDILHNLLSHNYLLPNWVKVRNNPFQKFDTFFGYSDSLQILAKEGYKLHSPAAEFIHQHADRKDISFENLSEADLLLLMMASISKDFTWRPHTLYYVDYYYGFPLFLNAANHKGFLKLAKITGVENADQLRKLINEGFERVGIRNWHNFNHNFSEMMNLNNLDTLK